MSSVESRVESGELKVEWKVESGKCKVEAELFVSLRML
jgi:hypothetical protein